MEESKQKIKKFPSRVMLEKVKLLTAEEVREITISSIADQFLDANDMSIETRAYLLKTTLPTVVLGLENLMKEMDKQGIPKYAIRSQISPNNLLQPDKPAGIFDALNWLGQYLFRNNPRHVERAGTAYEKRAYEISAELEVKIQKFKAEREALRIEKESRERIAREQEEIERTTRLESKKRLFQELIDASFKNWINCLWRKEPGELLRTEIVNLANEAFSDQKSMRISRDSG
jgi:hypothetical protein